jgi:Alpha-L-fucosidase
VAAVFGNMRDLPRKEERLKAFFQAHALSRKSFLMMISGAAAALSADAGSLSFLQAAVPPATEPLIRGLTPYIRLYGATAAEIGENAKLDNLKISVNCKDASRIQWNVTVPEEGEYDLFISCAVPGPGFHLEVIAGLSSVRSELKLTEGVYRPTKDGWFFNFERKRLDGRLHLTRGINPVQLQVSGADKQAVVHLRCLEVLPGSADAESTAAEQSARTHRASTDWFVKAVYGAMFHWTDFTQPRDGIKKLYPDAVNAFDVHTFARLIDEMGAGYVLLTLNHAHPHCPAPIQSWEAIHPGWTTRRDLLGDMAGALEKRGIRFLLYINSPVLTKLGDIGPTGLYELTCSEEQFAEIHKNVLTEIGSRYGDKLAGYWFDSWYQSLAAYPDVPIEAIYRYCKVGNPGRIAAFNFWIFPVLTPWQDYWAGELNALQNPFESRYIQRGAGIGLQAHGLLSMLPSWVHSETGPIPPPQFSSEDLIAYVKANIEHQAVTTINIGIYQDGTMEQSSLDTMRQLRRAIRGK